MQQSPSGTPQDSIWQEILAERKNQDLKWGGPSHDDTHVTNDWTTYIIKHLGRSVSWTGNVYSNFALFRRQMVIVAALSVAAIQWVDRIVARHPDNPEAFRD